MRGIRRAALAAVATVGAALLLCACTSAPAPAPTPTSTPTGIASVRTLAVMGDSISLGVNACSSAGPCMKESWAVGSDPAVDSLAERIGSVTGRAPRTVDAAAEGARVSTLLGAADRIIAEKPQLVAIFVGANDACAPSVDQMTSTADFTTQIGQLVTQLSQGLPDSHLLMLSVPDLNRLWELGHTNAQVAKLWQSSPSCRSLLWNAGSTDPADADRRAMVQTRVEQFNQAIATACAAASNCVSDGGAMYDHSFSASEVSTIDAFHPSVQGQHAIADIAWTALEKDKG
jgi:lysophospholipase L1-like esterase